MTRAAAAAVFSVCTISTCVCKYLHTWVFMSPTVISPQVQLLVSERDVDNYRLIKENLDILRVLVEEAELWVKRKESAVDTTASRKSVSYVEGQSLSCSHESCVCLFCVSFVGGECVSCVSGECVRCVRVV